MSNRLATIDFETRSPIDLPNTGVNVYVENPYTRILCMAYNLTGEKRDTKLWWSGDPNPKDLTNHIYRGGAVEAHNANFELQVWNQIGIDTYDWPELSLDQLYCSAAKSRACGLPGSLDEAGSVMGLATQKDKRGKQLIKLLTMPQRVTKNQPNRWNNDPELFRELGEYCVTDVNTEMELSHSIPSMSKKELAIWRLDLELNNRGVYIDVKGVKAALRMLDKYAAQQNKVLFKMTKGKVEKATQGARIIDWCEAEGYDIANMQEKTVDDAIKDKTCPPKVKKVLRIRKALARGSTGKYKAIMQRLSSGDRVRETVIYHKAHTGRWGGTGIQTQNFPRPTMKIDPDGIVAAIKKGDVSAYDNPYVAGLNALRPMLWSPPGKTLSGADFSAIEARILMWCADEQEALDIFFRGDCIYSDMASTIYNLPYEEIYDGYKNEIHEYDVMRKFGKDTILGLGYQMGGPKFAVTCEDNGTPIKLDFAKRTVKLYRGKYKKVVKLWSDVNGAAIKAIRLPKERITCCNGKVTFFMYKHWLVCKLPSGRRFFYPHATLKRNKWNKPSIHFRRSKFPDSTYGGKLTENIVSAIARDLLRDAMLRLRRHNYDIVLTVHDEIVSEIDEGNADHLHSEAERIMSAVPKWAEGIPVGVSGWCGKRFRKG